MLSADICKQPVSNLPEVTPRAATEGSVDGQSPFADLDQNGPDTFHGGLHAKAAPVPLATSDNE